MTFICIRVTFVSVGVAPFVKSTLIIYYVSGAAALWARFLATTSSAIISQRVLMIMFGYDGIANFFVFTSWQLSIAIFVRTQQVVNRTVPKT